MRTSTALPRRALALLAALFAFGLVACGPTGADPDLAEEAATAAPAGDEAADGAVAVLHRGPTCDCCGGHEAYLAERGFATEEVLHEDDLTAWKEARGIPRELWSCHTTEIGGYLVEGHVPAETIARLLEERPDIDGISLPGMPAGSPGMGGVQEEPWVIETFVDGEPARVYEVR